MNYLYTANEFRRQGLPVYTLELCFDEPELSDSIVVRGNSHMFHKERLCRILETHVPAHFKKIAFLDADILFDSTSWYRRTSKLLDSHDVVQPFEHADWLDLTYREVMTTRKSAVLMKGTVWDWRYHPGFAWAFRREWYRKVGFYDWAITGSADTLSAAAWLRKTFPLGFKSLPDSLKPSYTEYLKHPAPRITYLKDSRVSHLYHGSRENRKYVERHSILDNCIDIRELLFTNKDGVYEWVHPFVWNPKLLDYFEKRNDDDISYESNDFVQVLSTQISPRVQVPVRRDVLREAPTS